MGHNNIKNKQTNLIEMQIMQHELTLPGHKKDQQARILNADQYKSRTVYIHIAGVK